MNYKSILLGAAALSITTAAFADVEVRITGATAFRQATLDSIKAAYDSAGTLGTNYSFAHDKTAGGTNYNGSTRSVWRGKFPGVTGTTTIRCTFTGSVEGVRSIALSGTYDELYLTDAAISASGENGGKTSPTASMVGKFAFSDVKQSSTPITSPVLSPGDPRVGVVTFTMLGNKGNPASLTNVTSQQCRALLSAGVMPLSVLTGTTGGINDNYVVAVGRNDGSGTRTTYLAEIGYGISNPVNQYVAVTSTTSSISVMKRTASGDAFKSTVWSQDIDGNGGYASGSNVQSDFGKTTTSVELRESDNSVAGTGMNLYLVTWLSTGDAVTAITNGAVPLNFNGVGVTPAKPLSAADKLKVTQGQYTAWGYENLYYKGSLSTDENTVYGRLVGASGIDASIESSGAGIKISSMSVSRPVDGGTVAP